MSYKSTLFAAIAGTVFATSALADLTARPLSRDDAALGRMHVAHAELAAFRAKPRPVHMIRYPVIIETTTPSVRPKLRPFFVPRTRWDGNGGDKTWTIAAMSAVGAHGIDSVLPRDIAAWCPAYAENGPQMRRAFWVGMMSALSKHESTYNPRAVGGGGLWYGLLQIYPQTAKHFGCKAITGEALKNPVANLSCAARIMGRTIKRDRAVAIKDGRWRGVAADWGPMTKPAKIAEMSAWTRKQSYCVVSKVQHPRARPDSLMVADATAPRPALRPLDATVSTMNDRSFPQD